MGAQELDQAQRGKERIGDVGAVGQRERRPQLPVDLEISMSDPDQSLPRMRAGEFDLALTHDGLQDPGRLPAGVGLVALFEDPMYIAMPRGHRLADAETLRLTDFSTEPWMLATTHSCPDARLFMRACHAEGFEPQIAFQNDDYSAILGFVAAAVGVALVPDMVARGAREDVLIRELASRPPARPIGALVPSDYRSPSAAAMLAVLEEVGEQWVRTAGPNRLTAASSLSG